MSVLCVRVVKVSLGFLNFSSCDNLETKIVRRKKSFGKNPTKEDETRKLFCLLNKTELFNKTNLSKIYFSQSRIRTAVFLYTVKTSGLSC